MRSQAVLIEYKGSHWEQAGEGNTGLKGGAGGVGGRNSNL